MKATHYIIIILISVILTSCALTEDNPLHHKKAPSVMNNDDWSVTQRSGVLVVAWTPFELVDCDGYYIYRGLSQNGQYVRILELDTTGLEPGIDELEYEDHDILAGVYYYYKISGYKEYDSLKLEGKISAPISGRVN
ncbi:MAG: hypothetical protein JXR56_02555 [Candidatus Cloacimonetes bacterium]|nr:hypothetical protein [Candidatus Cloacimonadota bacterium]